MRKRIIIGLLAVAVIGLAAFFVSQPRKGSVEWHRDRYVELLTEDTWVERLRHRWRELSGRRAIVRSPSERLFKELELHEKALVRLGYFEERRFLLFNRRAEGVMMTAIGLWRNTQSNAIVRPQFDAVFVVGGSGAVEIGSVRSIGRRHAGELAESLIIVTQPDTCPSGRSLYNAAIRAA